MGSIGTKSRQATTATVLALAALSFAPQVGAKANQAHVSREKSHASAPAKVHERGISAPVETRRGNLGTANYSNGFSREGHAAEIRYGESRIYSAASNYRLGYRGRDGRIHRGGDYPVYLIDGIPEILFNNCWYNYCNRGYYNAGIWYDYGFIAGVERVVYYPTVVPVGAVITTPPVSVSAPVTL